MDLDIITKNIQKMTTKEKVTFIQTLLGVSGQLSKFLIGFQEKCFIPLPADVHYFMMISMVNLASLSKEDVPIDIVDYSDSTDLWEDKLISMLKQLNVIYKDKLK